LRQQIGFVLQLMVLMLLPLVIGWELSFGFPPIAMPASVLIAVGVFSVGQKLRQP
jgi:hypothetical protein